ncbi:CGNR zinc finger domain-containing protein [Paenibacillus sp. PL2-23]|uniref:CGNR zinc finger domain-containing protein n=1 Tax=Paenibacillus sp. PL2-23 TaxID=2100729 RepID=UPI0030F61DCB
MASPTGFSLISGHVALDLVNTEVVKRGIRYDLLSTDRDVAEWFNVIKESNLLFSHLWEEKQFTGIGMSLLKELRGILRGGFEHIADGHQPKEDWIVQLEHLVKQAPLSFQFMNGSLLPIPEGSEEASILSLIAFDTLQLLAQGDLLLLRRCANPDCVLLFMDTTGRRKWCSMSICGNRAKVARHKTKPAH